MLSRAETRVWVEHMLRGIVIAILAVMVGQSLRGTASDNHTVSARGIVGELGEWSAFPKAPSGIHMQLDSAPSLVERRWLSALAGAGSSLTWGGDLPPVMIDAQPIASPTGGTTVVVAAPRGSSLVLIDEVGAIDTIAVQGTGATLETTSTPDDFEARVNGSVARAIQRDSIVLNKVLVIGSAGWESKFVVAALEEEGWKVDAFIRVAPDVDVTHGSAALIDTSRYSAVVALDGAASAYSNRIVEFARTGGGVLLTPRVASLDRMTPLRAGGVGRAVAEALVIHPGGSASLATLSLAPITFLRSDAIPLERRAGAVTRAARRIDAGRVLQLGYEDTWQWRVGGDEKAVRDHRRWWTEVVSSVAYAPRILGEITTHSRDEAPMVGLVEAIGQGTPMGNNANLSGDRSDWMAWLFVLLSLGLIGEVTFRRMRGAP